MLLSSVLFNIFIDDILSRLEEANTHPPVMRNTCSRTVLCGWPGRGSNNKHGLQREINYIKDFCKE
jgi:hypothetical protein